MPDLRGQLTLQNAVILTVLRASRDIRHVLAFHNEAAAPQMRQPDRDQHTESLLLYMYNVKIDCIHKHIVIHIVNHKEIELLNVRQGLQRHKVSEQLPYRL